jgi:8-oxo-dGTP pyrophosphatase MutT (NUDIX family)
MSSSNNDHPPDSRCEISFGAYGGKIYDHRDVGPVSSSPSSSSSSSSSSIPRFETLDNVCLVESPWMRVARHTVRLWRPKTTISTTTKTKGKGKDDHDDVVSKVLDDWLWIDYHDRINVLVEAPPKQPSSISDAAATTNMQSEYMILEQSKYALDNPSLAIVGGIVEKDEYHLDAAKREVMEEMEVTCIRWTFLGNNGGASGAGGYRTDVNRGMGWVYPYLAEDCSYVASGGGGRIDDDGDIADVVGGRDVEERSVRRMTVDEVRDAVLDGRFVEVQWSNTVALAMLHLLSPFTHPVED